MRSPIIVVGGQVLRRHCGDVQVRVPVSVSCVRSRRPTAECPAPADDSTASRPLEYKPTHQRELIDWLILIKHVSNVHVEFKCNNGTIIYKHKTIQKTQIEVTLLRTRRVFDTSQRTSENYYGLVECFIYTSGADRIACRGAYVLIILLSFLNYNDLLGDRLSHNVLDRSSPNFPTWCSFSLDRKHGMPAPWKYPLK